MECSKCGAKYGQFVIIADGTYLCIEHYEETLNTEEKNEDDELMEYCMFHHFHS